MTERSSSLTDTEPIIASPMSSSVLRSVVLVAAGLAGDDE